MKSEYLEMGPCPTDETPVQVGEPDYYKKAHIECARWKKQLENHFSPIPYGVWLSIKPFIHDFGEYWEVIAYYPEERDE